MLRYIHKNSVFAARAAQCAHEQGKFWDMHDIIFANKNNQDSLNKDSFLQWTNALELDIGKYNDCLNSEVISNYIKDSYDMAVTSGFITGIPTYFINGRRIKTRNYNAVQYLVDNALGLEKNYIITKFDLSVLNDCSSTIGYVYLDDKNKLLEDLFIELELDPEIIKTIRLEREIIYN